MEPKRDLFSIGEGSLYIRKCRSQFFIEPGVESSSLHETPFHDFLLAVRGWKREKASKPSCERGPLLCPEGMGWVPALWKRKSRSKERRSNDWIDVMNGCADSGCAHFEVESHVFVKATASKDSKALNLGRSFIGTIVRASKWQKYKIREGNEMRVIRMILSPFIQFFDHSSKHGILEVKSMFKGWIL